jgi:hypothetical protein
MSSSEPLAYQRVLPLRPEFQSQRTLIRVVVIFVLIASCLQLTRLGITYLPLLTNGSWSAPTTSPGIWVTGIVLLGIIVLARLSCLIAAVGCLLLAASFRIFLLIALSTTAGASLLMSWLMIYIVIFQRTSGPFMKMYFVSALCQSFESLIFPAFVCFFLARRTTADAFTAPGNIAPRRPVLFLLLAWLGILSGTLGTFLKPAWLLMYAGNTRWSHDQSPWALGDNWVDVWSVWVRFSNLVLWILSIVLLAGAVAILLRRPWARRLIVLQAIFSVILTSINVALGLPFFPSHLFTNSEPDFIAVMFAAAILSLMLDLALWIYFGRHGADLPYLAPAV